MYFYFTIFASYVQRRCFCFIAIGTITSNVQAGKNTVPATLKRKKKKTADEWHHDA